MQARHEICAVEMMEVRHINKHCLLTANKNRDKVFCFSPKRRDEMGF